MNKGTNTVKDDGRVHPLAKTKPYILLSTTCDEHIVIDDWNLDEKSIGKWITATL